VLGAVLATLGRGLANDVFFQVGLLTTIGLSAKNAILIVEFAKELHDHGKGVIEAAVEAARMRLRPILMTTLAFVAGMIPLAFSRGVGAGQSKAIGAVVIGGQTFSLLLTLLAIPVAHSLFDDAGACLTRRRAGRVRVDRGEGELA
jgi:multidrug efflux pump